MCLMNYDFAVLSNSFLVHKPGIKSLREMRRIRGSTNRQIVEQVHKWNQCLPVKNQSASFCSVQ